jgi:ABC-type sugar transport system substrate-binding protein
MFKQWLLSAVLLAGSLVAPSFAAAAAAPAVKAKTHKTIRPFTAQLVNYDTNLPYATVISRLDAAINKTGCVNFLTDFHNSKTKKEQTDLISGILQGRNFLCVHT